MYGSSLGTLSSAFDHHHAQLRQRPAHDVEGQTCQCGAEGGARAIPLRKPPADVASRSALLLLEYCSTWKISGPIAGDADHIRKSLLSVTSFGSYRGQVGATVSEGCERQAREEARCSRTLYVHPLIAERRLKYTTTCNPQRHVQRRPCLVRAFADAPAAAPASTLQHCDISRAILQAAHWLLVTSCPHCLPLFAILRLARSVTCSRVHEQCNDETVETCLMSEMPCSTCS